jgi:hypothetical protein
MAASLPAYDLIPLPGEGPEDVVVGSDGSIYTGLLDGRILAVAPEDGAVREVAKTGGRPLGLEATQGGRQSERSLGVGPQDGRAPNARHS